MYTRPEEYDLENRNWTQDVRFYARQAKRWGGPVLELGCGTGRIALEIARSGLEVTALDRSKPMLDWARQKAERARLRVSFLRSDMRQTRLWGQSSRAVPRPAGRLRLVTRFGTILLPFNTLQHLTELDSVRSLFRRVRSHLAPGGRFLLDVYNPDLQRLQDGKRPRKLGSYVLPRTGERVVVTETHRYEPQTRINHVRTEYRAKLRTLYVLRDRLRVFFPSELDRLLESCGLRVENRYGDFGRRPFRRRSRFQVLVCGKL